MKKSSAPALLISHCGDILKNALVIDDDKICHLLVKNYMERTGFAEHLKMVATAKEGLHELHSCYAGIRDFPEVIFLDINMPEMNGWEFLEEYAKLPQDELKCTNIIMLTSSNLSIDITRAIENNQVFNYLEKPITIEKLQQLKEKIMTHLNFA